MKKLFVAMVLSCIFAVTISAQQNNNYQNSKLNPQNGGGGGGNGDGGTIAKSKSDSNSSAGVTYNGGNSQQFINALPGTSNTLIPGVVRNNDPWLMYRPGVIIPSDDIPKVDVPKKLKQKTGDVYIIGSIEKNDDPIHLVDYWPEEGGWSNDRILGQVTVRGKPMQVDLRYVTLALSILKELTHAERYAIRFRADNVANTSGSNVGGSGAASGMPFGVGIASAIGAMFGKSKTYNEEQPEIELIALNRGPYSGRPSASAGQTTSQSTQPEKQPDASQGGSSAGPMSSSTSSVPPVTSSNQQTPSSNSDQPVVADVTPARRAARGSKANTATVGDDLPGDVVFLYGWDSAELKEWVQENPWTKKMHPTHNQEHLEKLATWVHMHPDVPLQIEGYTCILGTWKHDENLGGQRAEAIVKKLRQMLAGDPSIKILYLSAGNQLGGPEGEWTARKAIAVVRGQRSDRDWNPADYQ